MFHLDFIHLPTALFTIFIKCIFFSFRFQYHFSGKVMVCTTRNPIIISAHAICTKPTAPTFPPVFTPGSAIVASYSIHSPVTRKNMSISPILIPIFQKFPNPLVPVRCVCRGGWVDWGWVNQNVHAAVGQWRQYICMWEQGGVVCGCVCVYVWGLLWVVRSTH